MLSWMGSQTLVPPDDSRYKVTEPITSNFLSADGVGKLLASTLPETGWNGLKLPKSRSLLPSVMLRLFMQQLRASSFRTSVSFLITNTSTSHL